MQEVGLYKDANYLDSESHISPAIIKTTRSDCGTARNDNGPDRERGHRNDLDLTIAESICTY